MPGEDFNSTEYLSWLESQANATFDAMPADDRDEILARLRNNLMKLQDLGFTDEQRSVLNETFDLMREESQVFHYRGRRMAFNDSIIEFHRQWTGSEPDQPRGDQDSSDDDFWNIVKGF